MTCTRTPPISLKEALERSVTVCLQLQKIATRTDSAGLEEMFLELTATSQREGAAA